MGWKRVENGSKKGWKWVEKRKRWDENKAQIAKEIFKSKDQICREPVRVI